MKRFSNLRLCLPILWASLASAHPAVDIVIDASGAVYYSDTVQVWRIAPSGEKTVAVPRVHTHQLWLDADGNLFGEHLEYHDPPVAGSHWSHRVWKRTPDGRISDVIASRKGFLSEYKDFSFRRDRQGAMYWLADNGSVEVRRSASTPIRTLVRISKAPSQRFGWMTLLPDGTAIVVNNGRLIRVGADGSIRTIHEHLSSKREQHSVMGAWTDSLGSVFVADTASGHVKKIAPDGKVSSLAASPDPWRPTGGASGPDGSMWILEVAPDNTQRVRRVSNDGASRVY